MINVVARLRVKDGKGDAFIAAAREQIAAVKQHEAGRALAYTLNRSLTDPNQFIFYESYADAEALKAHGGTDHMKVFGGALAGLLDGRPEIERMEPLAGLDG